MGPTNASEKNTSGTGGNASPRVEDVDDDGAARASVNNQWSTSSAGTGSTLCFTAAAMPKTAPTRSAPFIVCRHRQYASTSAQCAAATPTSKQARCMCQKTCG